MKNWIISSPKYESDILNPGLPVSPWAGHRNFAYDLIRYTRPSLIVELGTHFGCSFFAFSQSVQDAGLQNGTRLVAVDTWVGDSQAGFYEENVFELVTRTINRFFSDLQIDLKKKTFLEALPEIADNSIELLHIDGFHTYEAVSEDFHTWLPKLKENGIILFHDTAPDTGYGSTDFWNEIKKSFPYLEFIHSWGLGILFPKGDYWYKKMNEENIRDKIEVYFYKAGYELAQYQIHDLKEMADNRFKAINEMEKMIAERDGTIEASEALVLERQKAMEIMEDMIKERDSIIEGQKELIEERISVMKSLEDMIKERDAVIEGQKALIDERFDTIHSMEEMIAQRDEIIRGQQELVEERFTAMTGMERMIQERDESIASQNAMLEERYAAILEMEIMIAERDNEIKNLQALLEKKEE